MNAPRPSDGRGAGGVERAIEIHGPSSSFVVGGVLR
jgi:hypothetical protein